jgi:hypothetical protein
MLSRQEANAKSDKWMALAQAGMSLMQGGTGSFGGDLGKAGQTGLAALQSSRDSNDKSQLGLLSAIENSKLKREAIAASAAKGTATDPMDVLKGVELIDADIANIGMSGLSESEMEVELRRLRNARNTLMNRYYGLTGNSSAMSTPQAPGPIDVSTEKPGFMERYMLLDLVEELIALA